MGVVVRSSHVVSAVLWFSGGRLLTTLAVPQSEVSLMGDSSPQAAPS